MEKIDCTPTWAAMLPALLHTRDKGAGPAAAQQILAAFCAADALRTMAELADRYVAGSKANDALWGSLQAPAVDVPAMLNAAARILIQDNLGYDPSESACAQVAASAYNDGEWCCTEDEVAEFAAWFAHRTEDERWTACAGDDVGAELDGTLLMAGGTNGVPLLVRVPPAPNKVLCAMFDAICME